MNALVIEREVEQVDVERAWRDEAYYASLSAEQKALVPANPAGEFDPDIELRLVTRTPVACLPCSYVTCFPVTHTQNHCTH